MRYGVQNGWKGKEKPKKQQREHNMFAWLLIWEDRIHTYYYCVSTPRFPM